MKTSAVINPDFPRQIWNSSQHLAKVPSIAIERLIPAGARVVVISPHPGDEIFSCGGLLQLLAALDHPLQLISITDGSASYPGSSVWPQKRLSAVCPQESAEALRRLGLPLHSLKWIRGGFEDGALAAHEQQLCTFLQRYLRPDDVVFAPWYEDGNPDYDTVGRASAKACTMTGARLLELPVWSWHRPIRDDGIIPWSRARRIPLEIRKVAIKLHAAHAYASYLQGAPDIGLQPLLAPCVIERLRQPFEMVFI